MRCAEVALSCDVPNLVCQGEGQGLCNRNRGAGGSGIAGHGVGAGCGGRIEDRREDKVPGRINIRERATSGATRAGDGGCRRDTVQEARTRSNGGSGGGARDTENVVLRVTDSGGALIGGVGRDGDGDRRGAPGATAGVGRAVMEVVPKVPVAMSGYR